MPEDKKDKVENWLNDEDFKKFVDGKFASESVYFLNKLKDSETSKPNSDVLKNIYENFVVVGSDKEVNISAVNRNKVKSDLESGGLTIESFKLAKNEVITTLQNDIFSSFQETDQYKNKKLKTLQEPVKNLNNEKIKKTGVFSNLLTKVRNFVKKEPNLTENKMESKKERLAGENLPPEDISNAAYKRLTGIDRGRVQKTNDKQGVIPIKAEINTIQTLREEKINKYSVNVEKKLNAVNNTFINQQNNISKNNSNVLITHQRENEKKKQKTNVSTNSNKDQPVPATEKKKKSFINFFKKK